MRSFIHNAYKNASEYILPPLSESRFKQKGVRLSLESTFEDSIYSIMNIKLTICVKYVARCLLQRSLLRLGISSSEVALRGLGTLTVDWYISCECY